MVGIRIRICIFDFSEILLIYISNAKQLHGMKTHDKENLYIFNVCLHEKRDHDIFNFEREVIKIFGTSFANLQNEQLPAHLNRLQFQSEYKISFKVVVCSIYNNFLVTFPIS